MKSKEGNIRSSYDPPHQIGTCDNKVGLNKLLVHSLSPNSNKNEYLPYPVNFRINEFKF